MKVQENWKVVYVASRQEKKASLRMEQLGIVHFLPLYNKLSQWSDRKKWVEVPLFNGYMFVRPTALQRDSILQIPGVVAFVRYNGDDAIVQEKEITTIKTVLASGYSLETINTPQDFIVGEQVEVVEGPLKGRKVDILRQNDKEHFLVSFGTMGQSIKISLPYQALKRMN
ncbi:MAG: UpxY family transcription antiterminator [Bacteroidia bacterium]|tara:strand:- start:953 stop:1462 length:510 start_codon:yes stop_codon:yes gene_type:complete